MEVRFLPTFSYRVRELYGIPAVCAFMTALAMAPAYPRVGWKRNILSVDFLCQDRALLYVIS